MKFWLSIIFIFYLNLKCIDVSESFVCGLAFEKFADFIYQPYKPGGCEGYKNNLNLELIKSGSVIFTTSCSVGEFFKNIHVKLKFPYILITHGDDEDMPGEFLHYLNDSRIICWFGINSSVNDHPKFIPIPIGVYNREYIFNSRNLYSSMFKKNWKHSNTKSSLLYLNYGQWTSERVELYKLFSKKPYCLKSSDKSFDLYLKEMSDCKFVLSPRGFGLDCYRTWEAILVGSIPIVRSSTLNSLYKDLPVLIVDNWEIINEEFLNVKYKEICSKEYDLEKLYMRYWINKINSYKVTHS